MFQSLPLPLPESPPAPPAQAAHARNTGAWAAIHLPALALESLGTPEASDEAVAIVANPAPKAPVLALSAGARAAGIKVDMTAAAACARAGDLTVRVREPAREMNTLERFAAWSKQFTPAISPEPPDTLLLDIGASLRLFGGMEALRARLRAGLDAQGYTANLALAPTPRAALWLARAQERTQERTQADAALNDTGQLPGALGALPLSILALPPRSARCFERLGVETLGQTFRLPRDGLAKRFGPELLRDWDRALGRAPEPRRHWAAPSRFAAARELPDACRSLDRIEPFIDDLLTELAANLKQHDAGIDTLALTFAHAGRPVTRIVSRLLAASRDPARLKRLLHTRLERFALPAPAVSIRLTSGVFKTLDPEMPALPGMQVSPPPEADTLVETLCARLGRQSVLGLAPVADHRPENAWRGIAPGGQSAEAREAPAGVATASRPFWLLAEPQTLRERGGKPLYQGRALALEGPPERLEGGWWEAGDIGRDYYRARANGGAWLWVYREHRGGRRWFLHGYFAGHRQPCLTTESQRPQRPQE